MYKFTLIKRLWWNRKEFENLMEFISNKPRLRLAKSRLQAPLCIFLLLTYYTFVAVSGVIAGKNFVSTLGDWTPEWWHRRLVTYARYIFFVDPAPKMRKDAPSVEDIITWENVLAGFMAVGLLTRFLLGFFIDLSITTMTATLWTATATFSRNLQYCLLEKWKESLCHNRNLFVILPTDKSDFFPHTNDKRELREDNFNENMKVKGAFLPWSTVYDDFNTIRILSILINKALGSLVIWFVLEAIMYYSVNMDAFLITKDLFKRFYLLAYYLGTIGIFSLASSICHKVSVVVKLLKMMLSIYILKL